MLHVIINKRTIKVHVFYLSLINNDCFQALAKTMLKKQRTNQPVAHKEVPLNIAGTDEPKVTNG